MKMKSNPEYAAFENLLRGVWWLFRIRRLRPNWKRKSSRKKKSVLSLRTLPALQTIAIESEWPFLVLSGDFRIGETLSRDL